MSLHRTFILLFLSSRLFLSAASAAGIGPGAEGFVGSEQCGGCHERIFAQWRITPHAKMLRNAAKDPGAVAANDFSGVPFGKGDVRWVVGSHWVQVYLTGIDNEFYLLPNSWDLVGKTWKSYPIGNRRERPASVYCDGCHTTGFDPATRTFREPSIGCEACHGPGAKHIASGKARDIVNPEKLGKERRDMICEACHTDGRDRQAGGRFPFPAYYRPGADLTRYFSDFFIPKPGSRKWYRGTMDYMERHRMFLYWQSRFYSTARACDVCGFERGPAASEERYRTRDEYCGTCHGAIFRLASGHSRHPADAAQCVDCHTPQVTAGGRRYSIHDHKFDFSGPELPCAECHGENFEAGKTENGHDFHFGRVRLRKTLTLEQACARCHPGMPVRGVLRRWKAGGN